MQATSDLYKEILSASHSKECRLGVGNMDTALEDISVFFGMDMLRSMSTSDQVFSKETPAVGGCVSAEISVEMNEPGEDIPRQAKLVPYVRITDGVRHSEWLPKGVFYVDTRKLPEDDSDIRILTLTGYDAMLMTEQDYPASTLQWPAKDIDVVREIAAFIGVPIDERTFDTMTSGYSIQYPGEYTCRETLGYIAAMYAGCFIMNDVGALRLVKLNGIPAETRYLIDSSGSAITFGGDRILV